MAAPHATKAFTIIELAIVLVIVGLLVGSIVVAQDLISNAAVKALVEQQQKIISGATTFRTRFHSLPGDIKSASAISYNLQARAGTSGHGDGNGLIEHGNNPAYIQGLGGETALFWRDLSDANYTSRAFSTATDITAANLPLGTMSLWLPTTAIQGAGYFHAYSLRGRHYIYIGGFASTATDANGMLNLANTLTPHNARLFDEKLDDGFGHNGTVIAITAITTNAIDTGTGTATDCLNTNGGYNSDGDDAVAQNCGLSVRAEF